MEKDIVINGNQYRIAQYRLEKRMIFHAQLVRIAGYGAKIADGIVNGIIDENVQLDQINIGEAVKSILDRIEPEKHTKFILETIKELLKSPKNAMNNLEDYFTNNFKDVYPLFIEIVEHNVSDSVSDDLKKKLASYAMSMLDIIAEPDQQSKTDSQKQKN